MDDGVDTHGVDGQLVAQVVGEETEQEHEPGHVRTLFQITDEQRVVDLLRLRSLKHVILKHVL